MEIWKDKITRINVQKLISMLLKETKSSGIPLSFINEIAISELQTSRKESLSEIAIIDTLIRMKNEGKEKIEEFEKIYFEFIKNWKQKKPLTWDFYIPFHLPLKDRKIHILSKKFGVISSKYLNRKINIKKLPQFVGEERRMNLLQFPVKYLYVSAMGANKAEAWNEVAQAFDLLRGILEFSSKLDRINLSIPFGQRQVSNFIHPEIIIVRENISDRYDYLKFSIEKRTILPFMEFSEKNLKNFKILTKKFKNDLNKNSTESLLADAIRLYSQAMDAMSDHNCFIGFWQLLECITLSENIGGKTDSIIKRIQGNYSSFFPIDISSTLKLMATKRNDIIHRGIVNIVKERDISMLRLLSQRGIIWLLNNSKHFPTKLHLEEYYKLKSDNKRKRVINDVLKQLELDTYI